MRGVERFIKGTAGKVLPGFFFPAALLLSSCASTSVPKEHLYLLPLPAREGAEPERKGAGPALVVPPVAGEGLFRGNLLWARVSEMEVESWVRHRWALPAPEVVRRALLEWGRRTGAFSLVTGDPALVVGKPRIYLYARLLALEEVDRPEGAVGRVELELRVQKEEWAPSGWKSAASWRGRARGEAPVEGQSAAAVVRALGRAFQQAMDRVLREWRRAGLLEKGPAPGAGPR